MNPNRRNLSKFTDRMINLREDRGISQEQLAGALEVGRTTIYRWETSKAEPRLLDIIRIAQFFAVTSDYLLGLEDEPCRNESKSLA